MNRFFVIFLCVVLSSSVGFGQLSWEPSSGSDPVVGENFNTFMGNGWSKTPVPGQLNSNNWRATGFSAGDLAYGAEQAWTSGMRTDYYRGPDQPDGVLTGGIYGFEVESGNRVLGVQPGGNTTNSGQFNPGSFEVRIKNNTGSEINAIDIGYHIWVRNDKDLSNSFNFEYSLDGSTFVSDTTNTLGWNFSTTADLDSLGWKKVEKKISLKGLNIPTMDANNSGMIYFKWSSAAVGGMSGAGGDDLGLDEFTATVVPEPSTYALIFGGIALIGVLIKKRFAKKE